MLTLKIVFRMKVGWGIISSLLPWKNRKVASTDCAYDALGRFGDFLKRNRMASTDIITLKKAVNHFIAISMISSHSKSLWDWFISCIYGSFCWLYFYRKVYYCLIHIHSMQNCTEGANPMQSYDVGEACSWCT